MVCKQPYDIATTRRGFGSPGLLETLKLVRVTAQFQCGGALMSAAVSSSCMGARRFRWHNATCRIPGSMAHTRSTACSRLTQDIKC